ncbi:hemolysin family protein [Acidobacteriota bacterium]
MTYVVFPLLVIFLLLVKGFFSGSEIALVNADKIRLQNKSDKGNKGSALVLRLFKKPEVLLGTTLVGTNISTVMLVTFGTTMLIKLFGDVGELYAMLIFTPLLLILGEIVPKSIYQQKSDELAPVIIYPLRAFSLLFFPIIFFFSRTARLVASIIGSKKPEQTVFVIREQLRTMVEMAEGVADIRVFDRMRIAHATRFSRTSVGETMTPLAEVTAISQKRRLSDAIALVHKSGYSRLPVYDENISNIVGVIRLTVWDLLDQKLSGVALSEMIKPALFVPSHELIDELFPILREREDNLAVVVDEYGTAIGIITMGDIIEEVIGRIDSDIERGGVSEKKKISYEKLDEDVYLMDSRISISEINEILGIELQSTKFYTVGGLVAAQLRRLPQEGESIVEQGFRFTVVQATDRTVLKVKVERDKGN